MTAGAGFLLAVLWFDLMFDVQVRGRREAEVPEPVLASIAAYYARVTTGAWPMNRLVATAMLATLAATVAQVLGDDPRWVAWTSLALVVAAIALAGSHTVPNAVRLGTRADPPAAQSRLARAILRDHLVCLALIVTLLAVQFAGG